MIALLLSGFLLGQVCDANALYPTSELGGTGVPSGTNFCYDQPTNSVCHYANAGTMFGTSNAAEYEWDGTTFTIASDNSAITYDLSLTNGVGAQVGFSTNSSTTALNVKIGVNNRWTFADTIFRYGSGVDSPALVRSGATSLTNPSLIPNGSSTAGGIGGNGAGDTSVVGGVVFPTSAVQTLSAATTIDPDSGTIAVVSTAGAVTLTSNPQISDGAGAGQILCIEGTSDTNTVTIVDGNGLQLAGGTNFTIADRDTWCGMYSGNATDWLEISRSDN